MADIKTKSKSEPKRAKVTITKMGRRSKDAGQLLKLAFERGYLEPRENGSLRSVSVQSRR